MSVSDFEEQIFTYLWRGLVLAGLLTVLWGNFAPAPNSQVRAHARSAMNTASSRVHTSSASANEAQ